MMRTGAVGVCAAAVALLGGCAASSDGSADADPALAPFYEQELGWVPCPEDPGLECAALTVPRDYEEPDDETRAVALYRLAPAGDAAGSVVVLPGGPGSSGRDYLAGTSALRELAAERAVVSYDQRGVGASGAVECEDDAAFRAREALDATPDTAAEEGALVGAAEAFAEGCGAAAGDDLAHLGTRELVRDLDVLRAALGEDRLTYYGYSYGSLVGLEYARAFPERVGRAVLDAPRPASRLAAADEEDGVVLGRLEAALDVALQACVDSPVGCRLGAQAAEARTRLEDLLAGLDGQPVEVSGTTLTREVVVGALSDALAAGPDAAAAMIMALGRAVVQDSWADVAMNVHRDPAGYAAFMTVTCTDGVEPVLSAAAVRDSVADVRERYPVFGETAAWWGVSCTGWPVEPTLEVTDGVIDTAGDVLVVTSAGDPLTPPSFVEEAARQADGASVLTTTASGHGGYWFSDCVRFTVNDFLVDGASPGVATCA